MNLLEHEHREFLKINGFKTLSSLLSYGVASVTKRYYESTLFGIDASFDEAIYLIQDEIREVFDQLPFEKFKVLGKQIITILKEKKALWSNYTFKWDKGKKIWVPENKNFENDETLIENDLFNFTSQLNRRIPSLECTNPNELGELIEAMSTELNLDRNEIMYIIYCYKLYYEERIKALYEELYIRLINEFRRFIPAKVSRPVLKYKFFKDIFKKQDDYIKYVELLKNTKNKLISDENHQYVGGPERKVAFVAYLDFLKDQKAIHKISITNYIVLLKNEFGLNVSDRTFRNKKYLYQDYLYEFEKMIL